MSKSLLKTDSSVLRMEKNIAAGIDMIRMDELSWSQEDKSLIKSVLCCICVE